MAPILQPAARIDGNKYHQSNTTERQPNRKKIKSQKVFITQPEKFDMCQFISHSLHINILYFIIYKSVYDKRNGLF
jgi:hypothetical protein